jgi:uncharacterized Tic20 family protein
MTYPAPSTFVPAPSQNDRIMTAACHVSSLVGFGIVAPLAIYLTQRDRSGFVARHALQALFLQLFHLISLVVVIGLVLVLAGAFFASSAAGHSRLENLMLVSFPLLIAAIVIPTLAYFVAMIVGVIECMQGKEASLPLLGSLARSMHKQG